jgi:uroporphyrinogen decarboxylase
MWGQFTNCPCDIVEGIRKTMNSKERVLLAASHQEPDRVPITFDGEDPVKESLKQHFGVTTKEGLWDALYVDTWFVGPESKQKLGKDLGNGESLDMWGVKWRKASYGKGSYTDVVENPLKGDVTLEIIKNYPWPPLDVSDYSVIPAKADAQKDRAIIAACGLGLYFRASFVRGMDELLMDMMIEKERAWAVLDPVREHIIHQVKELMKAAGDKIDIYYIADDFCMQSAPMMPPGTFKDFFIPYIKEIADIVHEHDCKYLFHVCGAVRPFLPLMIEAGVDMLEPIQTRAEGMAVEGLKKDFGDDLCFYGSIDLQEVLCKGTPDTVRQEVLKNMQVLGQGGGFIVGPGHTYIQPDAPLENILMMYKTAYEKGIY